MKCRLRSSRGALCCAQRVSAWTRAWAPSRGIRRSELLNSMSCGGGGGGGTVTRMSGGAGAAATLPAISREAKLPRVA